MFTNSNSVIENSIAAAVTISLVASKKNVTGVFGRCEVLQKTPRQERAADCAGESADVMTWVAACDTSD